ncbi:lipoxygenase 1, chloroplastic [Tanacetum coccineum]
MASSNKRYGKWRDKDFNKEGKESMKWKNNPNARRASTSQGTKDKSKLRCYDCGEYGHLQGITRWRNNKTSKKSRISSMTLTLNLHCFEVKDLSSSALPLNADGVIEQGFTPGRYCMEISAAAYKHWRFDLEGLPADLIKRGMAVPDPSQRHGLKLLIEDYPYASDGLLIFEAIQNWVQTYVTRYYPDPSLVCNDTEPQAWYAEVINVGHAHLRYENWWPTLANAEDLTAILTTIIWLASAQHAALNFGQYPYGGYIPNRPPRMRRLIPDENDPEYASFLEDPQNYFLLALPSMLQSTKYMAVVDTLSTHSPDEEYIGERQQRDTWSGDAEMVEAFYGFASEIQRIEKEIEKRNRDMSLKNRCGAGVLPYELLAPSSGPGVTCHGIPNSVSI